VPLVAWAAAAGVVSCGAAGARGVQFPDSVDSGAEGAGTITDAPFSCRCAAAKLDWGNAHDPGPASTLMDPALAA